MKARIKLIPVLRFARDREASRRERTREESRRFASNVSLALVAAGVIGGVVVMANKWQSRELATSVRIVGRAALDSAEIMRYAGTTIGGALEAIDLEAVERSVLRHPYIERVSAYRAGGGTLVLEITERAPVAVMIADGSPVYLDSTGVMLPYRFSRSAFDLPVLVGIERIVERGEGGGRTRAVVPDSVRACRALGLLATIRRHDDALYRQISELRLAANGEYTLVTSDAGVPICLGNGDEPGPRLRKLDRFLTSVVPARGLAQAAMIDLRWKGQVVVRWRAAGARGV